MHPGTTVTGTGPVAPPAARRAAVISLARSSGVALAIGAAYFLLPMTRLDGRSWLALGIGLALVAVVLGWQLREITRSPFPRLRGVEALVLGLVLFFVVFATVYYVMGRADPADFTEPLTRLDSMYFTVTVFATVGFGDIAAVSQPARAVATIQMLGDLVLVGFVARMLVNAVQVGLGGADDRS